MNVLFHTLSAVGVVAVVTDTRIVKPGASFKIGVTSILALLSAVFFHGVLDYLPHCYPVQSKWDVAISMLLMILGLIIVRRTYRLIILAAFAGCVLPDIIDLLPAILNKYAGLELPIREKLFPWHQAAHSGSIYSGNCETSNFNHFIIVFWVLLVCYARINDLKNLLR